MDTGFPFLQWLQLAPQSWVCLSSAGKPMHASVVAKLQWWYRPCLQQPVSSSFHGAPWTSWCRRQQCFTGFIISVLITSNSSGLKYFYWEVSFKCKIIWTFSPQRHVFLSSFFWFDLIFQFFFFPIIRSTEVHVLPWKNKSGTSYNLQ